MPATSLAPVALGANSAGQRHTKEGAISTSSCGNARAASGIDFVRVALGPMSSGARITFWLGRASVDTRRNQPGKISAGLPSRSRAGMRSAKRADTASTRNALPCFNAAASSAAAKRRSESVASGFSEPLSTSATRGVVGAAENALATRVANVLKTAPAAPCKRDAAPATTPPHAERAASRSCSRHAGRPSRKVGYFKSLTILSSLWLPMRRLSS
mmetsp:Transcript_21953/g.61375  ORF Transcript_21953/g.61375 Transcript_21953/m.61375 type:complete len:215 (-) Transcript_21953:1044-1688(-)